MKILLLALQRTGSKLVHSNLRSYLATANNSVILHEPNGLGFSWEEPRHQTAVELDANGHVVFTKDISLTNPNDIYLNRIPHLQNLTKDVCIKVHYDKGVNAHLLEFTKQFDKVIVLKRRDTLEQLLSFVLSVYSMTWSNTNGQRVFKQRSVDSKVRIDENAWRKFVHQFAEFRDLEFPKSTTVYFEDMIKIKNSFEFCDALGLKTRDFLFDQSNYVEFGADKYQMISNIDRLVKIYNDVTLMKN